MLTMPILGFFENSRNVGGERKWQAHRRFTLKFSHFYLPLMLYWKWNKKMISLFPSWKAVRTRKSLIFLKISALHSMNLLCIKLFENLDNHKLVLGSFFEKDNLHFWRFQMSFHWEILVFYNYFPSRFWENLQNLILKSYMVVELLNKVWENGIGKRSFFSIIFHKIYLHWTKKLASFHVGAQLFRV